LVDVQAGVHLPRYFFHFSDGKRRFSDTVGQELRGLAAARQHAVQQVRELKLAMCDPHIQDLSGWSMTVADARGGTVFEIGFDLGNQGSGISNQRSVIRN
jgi:hypothetical protein